MTPLKVKGFAMPYDKIDSYNEVVRPGAFKTWFKHHDKVPMHFMHDGPCGVWTKITDTPEGLEVEGEITHPIAIKAFQDGLLPELSISFRQAAETDGSLTFSEARVKTWPKWAQVNPPFRTNVVPLNVVEDADLIEISLVDRGAMPNTHFEEVR